MKEKILIADDDPKICSVLSDTLKESGFKTVVAHTTEEAWERLVNENPNLILVDVEIPLRGGLEFCRQVKEKELYQQVPVIFLTVRDQEIDKVSALNLGADDFITKPFRSKELVASIRVVLKRYGNLWPSFILQSDSLFIDFDKRIVRINRKNVHLAPKEFEILKLLCKNRHKVLSDRTIFEQVWGANCDSLLSTVYTHIDRLRKKMRSQGAKVRTVPGFGYRFDERIE